MFDKKDILRERLSIVICDDTKENLDILVTALEGDYETLVADSGEIALKIITKFRPDMILLDVAMPGMDGYMVCSLIKSNPDLQEIPILFITGMANIEDKRKGFELGAVDYITKPFDVEEVKARVHAQEMLVKKRNIVLYEYQYLKKTVREKDLELEQAYQELELAHLETIDCLSRAAEYKDDNTGMHVKRVGIISALLAEQMGMDEAFVRDIEHAAPLHDIGKIGISESILLKPGKLNAEEWVIMREHAVIGRNILKNSSSHLMKMAELIAYTHHEKWNGMGYPLGLVGGQIPKVSRIVAVSDVFDALISERPYKKAFSNEEAIAIIAEESGRHFDPEIVTAFLKIKDKMLEAIDNLVNN